MTEALQKAVEALEPCPFCGGDELSHGWEAPGINGSPSTGIVECHNCSALVYAEPGEAEAIAAWNRRAALAEPDHVALIVAWLRDGQNLVGVWDGRAIADAIERRAYLPEGEGR